MAETVHVRFPDDVKDNPDDATTTPNPVVEIVAHKLDDYRKQGYIQCNPDGSKVASPQKAGAAGSEDEPVKLAGAKDDPEAAKVRGEDVAPAASTTKAGGSN